jgi:hypothetical protein
VQLEGLGQLKNPMTKIKPWIMKAHISSHMFIQTHDITLDDYRHLRCDAMQSHIKVQIFQGNLLPSQGAIVVEKIPLWAGLISLWLYK